MQTESSTDKMVELIRECDVAALLANTHALNIPPDRRLLLEERGVEEMLKRFLGRASELKDPPGGFKPGELSGVQVTYRRSWVATKVGCGGRRFAVDGLSMQSMAKEFRHTLAHDLYHDIDVVNAHPVIFQQWCARNHVPVPALDEYIAARDAKLAEIVALNPINRDSAKKVVLAVMNGGRCDADALASQPDWLKAFRKEMEGVHARMFGRADLHELRAVVQKQATKNSSNSNIGGSLLNHVVCDIEDKILGAAVSFLCTRGIPTGNLVLVFDGFMIPRGLCDINNKFLDDLEAHVFAQTGYDIRFVEKPMDCGFDLSLMPLRHLRRATRVAESDLEAAKMILDEDFAKRVRFCGAGRTFARTRAGVWTDNAKDVAGVIKRIVAESGIKRADRNGLPQEYAANDVCARAIVNMIMCDPPTDPGFPDKLRLANVRKVFYADGVFDFNLGERGEFRAETEDDMPVFRIQRKFPRDHDRCPALEQEVRHRIMDAAFGDPEVVNTVLQHLARALACEVDDKQFVVVLGFRNSGKGSMTAVVETAFGPFVGTLNCNVFLHVSGPAMGGDQAKNLSWVLATEHVRIAFTQEIKVDPFNVHHRLDGNALKMCISGADAIMVRRNYGDEVQCRFDARLFMMCNEFPPVKPADALENVHVARTQFKYVSRDEFEDPENNGTAKRFMRIGDPDIKAWCRRTDVADAFTWLVLDAYRRDGKVVPCDVIKRDTCAHKADLLGSGRDEKVDAGDGVADTLALFKIGEDLGEEDTVSSAEATRALEECGIRISKQALRQRIEAAGGVSCNAIWRDGKKCRGWKRAKLARGEEQDGANGELGEAVEGLQV